jgi:hemoglobin-like flavoprotein
MVRRSCAGVADRPVQLAESFYEHLFELAPAVRGMFAHDMSLQNERMSRMLMDVVLGADNPDRIERILQRMGAEHGRHLDVVPEHYPFVGRAIVRAVRDLSPEWSPALGSAWVLVYEWMAAHMVLGAERDGLSFEEPADAPAAAPAYGQPAYDQPAYGQPVYRAPAFGARAYGVPSGGGPQH